MNYKRTEDLLNQLKADNISYEDYLLENEDCFIKNDLCEIWEFFIKNSGMKKSDIINLSDIGYTYFYDIIRGDKIPSRDKLFRIVLTLNLPYDDIQNLLRLYGHAMLYPKFKRDSVIIYAIEHNYSVNQLQELLNSNNEDELK